MDSELKDALRSLAEGRHPLHGWHTTASHITRVSYVGIAGRRGAVQAQVIHPPRIGEHIRWMKFSKGDVRCSVSYYEIVQVLWDVRDARHYSLYRPGEEGECYLTVFVKPVKRSPGEAFDRANHAQEKPRQRRRRKLGSHQRIFSLPLRLSGWARGSDSGSR
jgi:hypothetical protein